MSSKRKHSANQKNAQKSTGPISTKGKSRSSQNALSHGLSAKTAYDPETETLIDGLAKEFLGASEKDFGAMGLARDAAEAQIQMHRIQNLKRQAWGPSTTDVKIKDKGMFWLLPLTIPKDENLGSQQTINIAKLIMPHAFEPPFNSEEEMNVALKMARIERLQELIRYERQFANRRDRALRALTEYVA